MPAEQLAGHPVVVTGATGFIGRHLVRRLAAEGAEVHGFVRRVPNDDDGAARWWTGDVTDYAALRACMQGSGAWLVVHLAADTSVRRFDGGIDAWDAVTRSVAVNLGGSLNVLQAARASGTVRRVVRVGGLEEYGVAPTPYREDEREAPISPYSASQVATTHYYQMLQRSTDATVLTVRPALVYGPGQSTDFLIPGLIERCLDGGEFAMSDGLQRRDLIYVDDLIDALVRSATHDGLAGAVVNVGSGVEHAVRDVATTIVRLVGTGRVRFGERPRRLDDLVHLVTTTDRAETLLGWQARTSLDDGLARTVAWHRAQRAMRDAPPSLGSSAPAHTLP